MSHDQIRYIERQCTQGHRTMPVGRCWGCRFGLWPAIAVLSGLLVTGCGQKGPLYKAEDVEQQILKESESAKRTKQSNNQ